MAEKKYKFDPVFDLNRGILEMIFNDFQPMQLVDDFNISIENNGKNKIEEVAQTIFKKAAHDLVEHVVDIADRKEYRDRGYQILREYCMRPENELFPHLIQRFIEVLYLSINPKQPEVGILEASRGQLMFWIDENECYVYHLIKEKCGEDVSNTMPCRHLCLNAIEHMVASWEISNCHISMDALMAESQLCKFNICRPGIQLPKVPVMRWEG